MEFEKTIHPNELSEYKTIGQNHIQDSKSRPIKKKHFKKLKYLIQNSNRRTSHTYLFTPTYHSSRSNIPNNNNT